MSNQLDQLLGYLERDGVTEILFGTGRPIAMRNARGLTNLTARALTAEQLAVIVRNEIAQHIPSTDGEGDAFEIRLGRRRAIARVARRGEEIFVSLRRVEAAVAVAEPQPSPPDAAPLGTQPLTRVDAQYASTQPLTRVDAQHASTQPLTRADAQHASTQPVARADVANPAATQPLSRIEAAPLATQPLARVAIPPSLDAAVTAGVRFSTKPAAARETPTPVAPPVTGSGTMAGAQLAPMATGSGQMTAARLPAMPTGSGQLPAAKLPARSTPEAQRGDLAEDSIDIGDLADVGDLELDYGPAGAPSASQPLVGLAAAGPSASARPAHATSPPTGLAAAGPNARPGKVTTPPLAAAGPNARPGRVTTPPLAAAATAQTGRAAGTPPTGLTAATAQPSARVDQTFDAIVRAATHRGASDLHVAAGRVTALRLIGELVPLDAEAQPMSADAVEAMLLPLLDEALRAQLDRAGYVDLALDAPSGGRLRANISRHQQGLKGTFRIALGEPATLDQLGLPAELAKVVAHHQGLVIVAGPSGHGKTTTLAALVDLLNSTRPYHILTIEDPIEIVHPRKQAVVSQRETGRHTESFARGLKASLREDPDVIVIGELRDRESVEIALTAAETGHLVIATMSTPSASKTIDRLIDMFPPEEHSQVRASIAGALRAIVAQRLLPKRGGGVVPAVELVTGVLPLAVMIRDDKLYQLPNLLQRGRAFGMIRFDESLAEHVRAGRLDEETALAAAESKKDLAAALRPAAPDPGAAAKTSQLWGFGKKDQR